MTDMTIQCPACGSTNVRYSRIRTLRERLWTFAGVHPLRCRSCRQRFARQVWRLANLRYARCPKCFRMDLNLWEESRYVGSGYTIFLLRMGAHPYRCEYCHLNFASFRGRKEHFDSTRSKPSSKSRTQGSGQK